MRLMVESSDMRCLDIDWLALFWLNSCLAREGTYHTEGSYQYRKQICSGQEEATGLLLDFGMVHNALPEDMVAMNIIDATSKVMYGVLACLRIVSGSDFMGSGLLWEDWFSHVAEKTWRTGWRTGW